MLIHLYAPQAQEGDRGKRTLFDRIMCIYCTEIFKALEKASVLWYECKGGN